jgi:hypothetical protein
VTVLSLLVACQSQSRPDVHTSETIADGTVSVTEAAEAQVQPVVCAVDGVDADSVTYAWTVDGEPHTGITLTTANEGDTVFPGYTRPEQVWTCVASAWKDGVVVATGEASTEIAEADVEALDPFVAPDAWMEDTRTLHYAGALADADTLSVTWGVDGWAPRRAAPGSTMHQYETMPFYADTTTNMTFDGNEWTAQVILPDTARAVHMIFTDGTNVDDADGHQLTWDLEFPSVGPYLTWNDEAGPSDGIVVNWVTGQPGYGIVAYGPDEDHLAYVTGKEFGTIHHVVLGGLPAGQEFVYRVTDSTWRSSDLSTFRTAAVGENTYTFLVASDMQDTGGFGERWPDIAAEMAMANPDARYILSPGDLPADDEAGLWWLFFDGGRDLFDHVPLVPALGNHDTPGVDSSSDTSSWRYWFSLPESAGNEAYYRIDYGRTRIFAINTEVSSQMNTGEEQYVWLEDESLDLIDGENRAADWAIAAFHKPPYDAGGRFARNATELRDITELFDGTIDACITGHEHIYQRFLPLQYDGQLAPSGNYGLGPDDGVLYLVTPAAGFMSLDTAMVSEDAQGGDQLDFLAWPELAQGGDDDEDDDHDEGQGNDETVYAEGLHGYLLGEVSPTELSFSFVAMGNSSAPDDAAVRDSVTITH